MFFSSAGRRIGGRRAMRLGRRLALPAAAAVTTTTSRTVLALRQCHPAFFPESPLRVSRTSIQVRSTMASSVTFSLPPLIDVDCNLWHEDLKSLQNNGDANVLDILREDAVKEANVVAMVSPSSTIDEAERGLAVMAASSEATAMLPIKTTVGLHPYHVNDEGFAGTPTAEHIGKIKELLQYKEVCAVGECGLDATDGFPPMHMQLPWFQAQVEIAQDRQLPLFVHERLAFSQTMETLERVSVPVLVHCFTGTREECRAYAARGYFMSVSGFICKEGEGAAEVRACLEDGLIPLDKLMVETDAPYMGFDDCRSLYIEKQADYIAGLNGKKRKRLQKGIYPNVPSALPQVVDRVVQSLNVGRERRGELPLDRGEVAAHMTENASKFFGFSIQ